MRRVYPALLLALSIFLLDQSTKLWVRENLPYRRSTPVLGQVLRLTYIRNPNSVFGISLGSKFPYKIVAGGATLFLLWILFREERRLFRWIYGLLLGGALGNLTDRWLLGEVVDFIDVGVSVKWRWPIFNIADSAVTVGLVILVVSLFFPRRKKEEPEEVPPTP